MDGVVLGEEGELRVGLIRGDDELDLGLLELLDHLEETRSLSAQI